MRNRTDAEGWLKIRYPVSEQAGVNIILCTGFHKTEFFENPRWLERQTEETLTNIYTEEIQQRIYSFDKARTTAKAGIIKYAAIKGEHKASATYEKLYNAVANAARKTGVPVMVHMDGGADAFAVLKFFGHRKIKKRITTMCILPKEEKKEVADMLSISTY